MTEDDPTSRNRPRGRPAGRPGRVRLAAAPTAALTAGITGCSGQPASQSASRSPSGHASTASTPTGPELAKLLPPHVSLPPGWTPSHLRIAYWNRTAKFSKPLAELGPPLPGSSDCSSWTSSLSPQDVLGNWEMSFAIAEAYPPGMPVTMEPVVLEAADFRPGDALRQLAADAALARRCPHYRDPSNNSKVTVTAAPVPGLGQQSLYIDLVNPYPLGGSIIHDHTQVLLARVGNDIIGVGQSGNATNSIDPVVPFTDLKQAAQRLIATLTAGGSTR
jgi:hypothetical protein